MSNLEALKDHALAPSDAGSNKSEKQNRENYIDYRTLPIHKARIKFYNNAEDKKFGFVTILGENDEPQYDAFLSGTILEKAGIYNPKPETIIYVRHVTKAKGESVVYVQKRAPEDKAPFGKKE